MDLRPPQRFVDVDVPEAGDLLALELRRHLDGLVWPDEPRIVDLDRREAPSVEDGLELGSNGLDLRQLRHRASVVRALWATWRGASLWSMAVLARLIGA